MRYNETTNEVILMKLYQALTQIQINGQLIDTASDFTVTESLTAPLNFTPAQLTSYIDAVLKPGSRHDENNLRFVTDPGFIGENFDFLSYPLTQDLSNFEQKMQFARQIVADLNRHVAVNVDTNKTEFQIIFVD